MGSSNWKATVARDPEPLLFVQFRQPCAMNVCRPADMICVQLFFAPDEHKKPHLLRRQGAGAEV